MHEVELMKRVCVAIDADTTFTTSPDTYVTERVIVHVLAVLGLKPMPDGTLPVFLVVPPGADTHIMQVAQMAASLPIDPAADAMASAAVARRATGKKVTKLARKK